MKHPVKTIGICILLISTAWLPACGRKEKSASPPPPNAGGTPQADGTLVASKDGLKKLTADANPYIRNNAKAALQSWEAKDYTAAVIAMQKIIGLCRSDDEQTAAITSLGQLKTEIDAAVSKGDSNAKEAAAQLQQMGR